MRDCVGMRLPILFFFLWKLQASPLHAEDEFELEEEDFSPKNLELVQPRAYAIKRFEEIVSDYQSNQGSRPSDRLIRKKALLNASQREKDRYLSQFQDSDQEADRRRVNAYRVMVDHYAKRVKELENQIRRR